MEEDHKILENSQASSTRPASRSAMNVKILQWWDLVASDRGQGILVYCFDGEGRNLER
jgi:hypothetical protein